MSDNSNSRLGEVVTPKAIRDDLLFRVIVAGGQKEFALAIGVSAGYLCEVLRGSRPPGKKILKFLGLQRQIVYTRMAE